MTPRPNFQYMPPLLIDPCSVQQSSVVCPKQPEILDYFTHEYDLKSQYIYTMTHRPNFQYMPPLLIHPCSVQQSSVSQTTRDTWLLYSWIWSEIWIYLDNVALLIAIGMDTVKTYLFLCTFLNFLVFLEESSLMYFNTFYRENAWNSKTHKYYANLSIKFQAQSVLGIFFWFNLFCYFLWFMQFALKRNYYYI